MNNYLFLKRKYESIISNINEIIFLYNEILVNNIDNTLHKNLLDEIAYYEEKCAQLNNTILQIDIILTKDCDHNYVEDEIDITPECSKRITYCTICEHTL